MHAINLINAAVLFSESEGGRRRYRPPSRPLPRRSDPPAGPTACVTNRMPFSPSLPRSLGGGGGARFPLVRKKAVNQLQSSTDNRDDRRAAVSVPRSPHRSPPPSVHRSACFFFFVQTVCPPPRPLPRTIWRTQNTKSQHHLSPSPLYPNNKLPNSVAALILPHLLPYSGEC